MVPLNWSKTHDESGCIVKQIRYDVSILGRSMLSSEPPDKQTKRCRPVIVENKTIKLYGANIACE